MTKIIKKSDKKYPKLLRALRGMPGEIYYKGNWDEALFERCLAVVGSRRITSYGRQAVKLLVEDCACAGITIVSGFMYGVDAAAHRAALDAGGRTIAVMPCGIELVCPEHQQGLYNEIIDRGGLIISEYPDDTPPYLSSFPARNRIVAGLSQATLVIEAALKSGSLITANLAKRYKRHVLAVPGPITSLVSAGTLGLIRQGASMVLSSGDILALYDLPFVFDHAGSEKMFSGVEKRVVDCLRSEPMRVDDLAYALNMDVPGISSVLSLMQLKGIVEDDYGKFKLNISEVR